jgi:hypothetical protein
LMSAFPKAPQNPEFELLRQLSQIEASFRTLCLEQHTPMLLPLWGMRSLQDAVRVAGFDDLARLLAQMETQLIGLRERPTADVEAVIGEFTVATAFIKRRLCAASPARSVPADRTATVHTRGCTV